MQKIFVKVGATFPFRLLKLIERYDINIGLLVLTPVQKVNFRKLACAIAEVERLGKSIVLIVTIVITTIGTEVATRVEPFLET